MLYHQLISLAEEAGMDVFERRGLPEHGCYAYEPGLRAVLLVCADLPVESKLLVLAKGLGRHSARSEELTVAVLEAAWSAEVEVAERVLGRTLRGGR